ncbi:MAG: DUF4258 domain-containing protein [Elusimicrobiota bacterium]
MDEILFEVNCFHFNKKIRTTIEYWQRITNEKHPSIKGQENKIISVIQNPDEIRQSKKDSDVFLYYRLFDEKYICVISKFLNDEGFIITAYSTTKIKEGKIIWKK